jgi:hypothetical protein
MCLLILAFLACAHCASLMTLIQWMKCTVKRHHVTAIEVVYQALG